jgi:hypothetical protein
MARNIERPDGLLYPAMAGEFPSHLVADQLAEGLPGLAGRWSDG